MAQQVFYPNNPLQLGPMYFLTPQKCTIFGVCCKAILRKVNYLIDEAVDMGKSANAVVRVGAIMLCVAFSAGGGGLNSPEEEKNWMIDSLAVSRTFL